MTPEFRAEAAALRRLTSSEAASWLMQTYPSSDPFHGIAFDLMRHRSWLRPDQLRLAEHYLTSLPFASARPYKAFASFMSVHRLISVIEKRIPSDVSRVPLLAYHLLPVLRERLQTSADRKAMDALIEKLNNAGYEPHGA